MNKNNKGQEEMVGFAVIVIIVAIIMLFLLVFYLRSPQEDNIESYKVNSFIQSFLQYTTECENNFGGLSVQELIPECDNNNICLNGQDSCKILTSTLKGVAEQSWQTGEELPIKGYELKIASKSKELISLKEGNITSEYKSGLQILPPKYGEAVNITFKIYY